MGTAGDKKRTWMDYLIYLFWLFLFFTVIYDLFLIPVRSIYWLAALFLSVWIYSKKWLPKAIYLLLAIFLVLQIFGELYFGFFYTIANYDKIDHILSGIEFCVLFYYMMDKKIEDKKLLILFSFFFSLSAAYVWELVEYFSDTYLGTTMVGVVLRSPGEYIDSVAKIAMPAYQDTIYDMFDSMVGGIIFIIGAVFLPKKKN